MNTLSIILLIYSTLATYVAVVQILRERKLENICNNAVDRLVSISKTINDTKALLDNDRLAVAFSNDDEVGRFFTQIKEIQNSLAEYGISNNEEGQDNG